MKASLIRLRGDTDTATEGTRRGNIDQRNDNAETQLIYRSNNSGCNNLLFLSLRKWLNLRSIVLFISAVLPSAEAIHFIQESVMSRSE